MRWRAQSLVPLGVLLLLVGVLAATIVTDNQAPAVAEEPVASVPIIPPARESAVRVAKDPTDIPPPVGPREPQTIKVDMTAIELDGQLADGMTFTYWTFDGTVPGQMIRIRQGDTVELTLHNDAGSTQPHSIDLHAVTGPGGGAEATQVLPGETKAFRFKALSPGVYVFHCATPYVPAHVANGMYGLIVVEPEGGLAPVDREFYVMQGEIYANLRPRSRGHASFDDRALWDENPNFVVFNGQFNALTGEHAMKATVGETVRIFIGNGGPNLASSFHVIGEIFDVVHKEAASERMSNVQTTLIPAGGAAWVEFKVDVPGNYTLVDHALNRALGKGAVAVLQVEGEENLEVFEPLGLVESHL